MQFSKKVLGKKFYVGDCIRVFTMVVDWVNVGEKVFVEISGMGDWPPSLASIRRATL